MKKRALCFLAALCLIFTGCNWMSGSYVSVEPHREKDTQNDSDTVSASNYLQLRSALEDMIQAGTESGVINVADYNQDLVEDSMEMAARYAESTYPVGAYAVDKIEYEVGTNAGKPAIAVDIQYLHSRVEIQSIRQVQGMNEAADVIAQALEDCDAGVVMLIKDYDDTDFGQLVADYAEVYPQTVMEIPQVTAGIYPESGTERVVELTFTYQTSRETLRQMQSQVAPVFNAAALYVSGEGADTQKYAQLYAFLMERFDYEITTSITPSYSLLRHGVGDNRAFAVVYAAMCRLAKMECMTVTGTRDGEPWCWNIILDNGNYFHVDLLRCSGLGGFREFSDDDMDGYVWDYSAYPECPPLPPVTETAQPATEETVPDTEAATVPTEEANPEAEALS